MNRVVFLIRDGKKVVDAAGRSLDARTPKWYRYGSSRSPFISGTNLSVACVVEDCASACAVSKYATGIALLGTNLLQKHIDIIKKYDKVGVALDRDATKKATKICNELNLIMNTKFLVLEDDIKNMADEDIKILVDKVNSKAWGWMNDTVASNKHL
jgi:DNA primase